MGWEEELVHQVGIVHAAAERVFAEAGVRVKYSVGTMIEVPRGALRAGDLAKHADFFSFGTNDLTQMTMGFSRDDAGELAGHTPGRVGRSTAAAAPTVHRYKKTPFTRCFGNRSAAGAKFLPKYLEQGILPADPFQELDTSGVGELIRIAVERGRAANPKLQLGICGAPEGLH